MIDHVSFVVAPRDVAACAGFYELLGFVQIEPPAGLGERSIWLTLGSSSIHLMFREADGHDVEGPIEPGAGHVAIVVERYEQVVAALAAAGVEVDPRSEYWGAARSYLRDPAGNRVELMAGAP